MPLPLLAMYTVLDWSSAAPAAGAGAGASVGTAVGASVGSAVGAAVGSAVGAAVGVAVGVAVGSAVGDAVGVAVGVGSGVSVGTEIAATIWVGCGVSTAESAAICACVPLPPSDPIMPNIPIQSAAIMAARAFLPACHLSVFHSQSLKANGQNISASKSVRQPGFLRPLSCE